MRDDGRLLAAGAVALLALAGVAKRGSASHHSDAHYHVRDKSNPHDDQPTGWYVYLEGATYGWTGPFKSEELALRRLERHTQDRGVDLAAREMGWTQGSRALDLDALLARVQSSTRLTRQRASALREQLDGAGLRWQRDWWVVLEAIAAGEPVSADERNYAHHALVADLERAHAKGLSAGKLAALRYLRDELAPEVPRAGAGLKHDLIFASPPCRSMSRTALDQVRAAVKAAYRSRWRQAIRQQDLLDAVVLPKDTRRAGDFSDGTYAVIFTEYAGLSQYDNVAFWKALQRELDKHKLYYEWYDGGTATIHRG